MLEYSLAARLPHVFVRLPPGVAEHVNTLLEGRAVDVCVVRARRTKLGDHRPPHRGDRHHRISINDDLNPYAFLTTLLHEIAHVSTWERHRSRRRVRPHGPEWQAEFRNILVPVLGRGLLPGVVEMALGRSLASPAAATCSDRGLMLALAQFDTAPAGHVRVEELPERSVFRAANGTVFRVGQRLRTRRQCFDLRTGREYRVHGLALVEPLAEPQAIPQRRSRR